MPRRKDGPPPQLPELSRKGFVRPHLTSANPNWWMATDPTGLIPTCPSDPVGAEFVRMIGLGLLTQGHHAGKRLSEVWLPWQREMLTYALSARAPDGLRLVRTAFIKIGKGNSKTTTGSLICLGVAMALSKYGWGQRALIAIMAPSVASADISFQHIFEAVKADSDLMRLWKSDIADRAIEHVRSGIKIQILPPRMNAAISRRPIMTLYDEVWASSMELRQYASIVDQLDKGGRGTWGDPWPYLSIHLTTAPTERAKEPYAGLLKYARQVRDGEIQDDSFLPLLYEWPTQGAAAQAWPLAQMANPDRWWVAMPSAVPGGPLDRSELEREFADVQRSSSPLKRRLLLSQRFGIEPDEDNNTRAGLQVLWPSIAAPITPMCDLSEVLVIAHDPGGIDDPHAMAIAWRDAEDRTCLRVFQFLLRAAYLSAGDDLRSTYDAAIEADELELFDTPREIDDALMRFHRNVADEAVDQVFVGGDQHGRGGFVTTLEEGVLGRSQFRSVHQGWQLRAFWVQMESMALSDQLRIVHAPLLDANMRNLRVSADGSSSGRTFSKADTSEMEHGGGEAKIDGVMACLSALALMDARRREACDVSAMIG